MSAVNSSTKSKTTKASVAGSLTPSAKSSPKSIAASALSRGQTVEYTVLGSTRAPSSKNLISSKSASKSAPRSKLTVMKSADGSRRSSLKPSRTGSRLPSRTASRDASRNNSGSMTSNAGRFASRTGLASSASRTTATKSILSVPKSGRSTARTHTSTRTPTSYNTVSNSRVQLPSKSKSTYLETPSASSRRTKTGTKFTIPTQKSGTSKYGTQYKLRNIRTCAGKTNAWEAVSQPQSVKSAKSSVTVSKTPKTVTRDIESQRSYDPKDIVIEEREVTKTRYSWWALSILAFLLCATLIFLIIKQIVESNQTGTTPETTNSATPNNAQPGTPDAGKFGKRS